MPSSCSWHQQQLHPHYILLVTLAVFARASFARSYIQCNLGIGRTGAHSLLTPMWTMGSKERRTSPGSRCFPSRRRRWTTLRSRLLARRRQHYGLCIR
ncbi:hypothetical protein EXIGLDRAFT_101956 [Exidia glandulosa HHB12029]|uniref:Uncharacterized protein n=1 Tax=Exidia glandulosa HHB12029 TaxID=1314781 RepID=A0A166AET3_EXIGL|nr:hypothetical protein EXIGLDRAFT_101956 [Exidia glandulosa HHB12029]